jgi:YD repeat-containing protein
MRLEEEFTKMRSPGVAISFVLLALLPFSLTGKSRAARQPERPRPNELLAPLLIAAYHGAEPLADKRSGNDQGKGIIEEVPEKFAARYLNWKREFLSTEAGRNQWALYQNNPHFTLRIAVSRDNAEGATTGNYEWNGAGQLVAATITLGIRLDAGYPNPIYFPVMNSLVPTESSYNISGSTLAATKIAHEFGHVNRTAKVDPVLYQLQGQLMPQYNKIFLSNGRNANDPRLIELAKQIGGTPVEIWEDREYWGEANAMVYLRDRITEESMRCSLFTRIRHSVDLYARSYETRFLEVAQATPFQRICGW